MSLVIYLGLHAFVREPDLIMPNGQLTMSLEALQKDAPEALSQQHVMLLEQLSEPEVQMLSQWLKQNSVRSIVLLWPHPALYVAAAMTAAEAPEQALQTWTQKAQQVLALFRKHRRQVQLAGYTPGEAPPLESATLELPDYAVSPLYRLAAAQLTLQDSTLQKAYSYLQASSVAGAQATVASVEDITALLHQKREDENEYAELLTQLDQAQQTLEEQHHQLKQAEKEQQSLTKQLADHQGSAKKEHQQQAKKIAELEQINEQQAQQSQQRIAQLAKEQEALAKKEHLLSEELMASKATQQALEQHLAEQSQESELLLSQLHTVQEILEGKLDELSQTHQAEQAASQKASELEKRLAASTATLSKTQSALKKEQSARSTEQQEYQQQIAKAQEQHQRVTAELASTNEENGLVIAELHRVQEVLEDTLEAAQKHQHQIKELETERSALNQQLNDKQTAYLATTKEVVELKRRLATQKKELQAETANTAKLARKAQRYMEQLHSAQEKLEQSQAAAKNLRQQQSVLTQQNEAKEKALAANKAALQKATDKAEQRFSQLHKAQEELEEQQQLLNSLNKRLENRQKNLNILRAERQQKEHELQSLVQWLRAHAYRHAAAAYRYSRAYKKALPEQVKLVQNSEYFDATWYCEQYPDVVQGNINPAEHFVKFGALEGRNPSARFNTEFYLAAHNDVAISGQHPLLHFLRHGIAEQRVTNFEQLQLPSPESTNATLQAFEQEAQA